MQSSLAVVISKYTSLFIFISAFIFFTSCNANKWYGTFEGTTTESSQINHLQPNGETKYYTGGRSVNGATVSLMREGNIAFVTFDNCRLRMTLDNATHAHVSDGQTCRISINSFEGKVEITGSARFDENGKLIVEFTGTAIEPNTNGGYVYNFQGERTE